MFETPQDSQPVLVLPVSGEMESTESRYAHLLQPIRELTKNWEIDLASELNDYLDEVIYLYHRGSYFDSFRPPYKLTRDSNILLHQTCGPCPRTGSPTGSVWLPGCLCKE